MTADLRPVSWPACDSSRSVTENAAMGTFSRTATAPLTSCSELGAAEASQSPAGNHMAVRADHIYLHGMKSVTVRGP